MSSLIWQGAFTFSHLEAQEIPASIETSAVVLNVKSNASDGASAVAYALQMCELEEVGSVSMKFFELIPGNNLMLLIPSSSSKLQIFPRWSRQILELKLWETTAEIAPGGEVGSDVATSIQSLLVIQQQILSELNSLDVEIDPAIAAGIQNLLTGQTQLLQALQSITVELDPAIAAQINSLVQSQSTQSTTLQGLETGQSQILQRLNQPIEAQLPSDIVSNINGLVTSQSEQSSALQQIQAGNTQILQALTAPAPPQYNVIATAYAASQSSTYNNNSALTGTFTNLTDNNGATGAGTNSQATEWIKATFPTAQTIRAIRVAGGFLPSWGGVAAYLNGKVLQYSTDDVNWLTLLTISGVQDSGPNQFVLFALGQPITARFWRILSNGFLSTSEFRFFS